MPQVGSGTDPSEGAALATALLTTLADRARFTFATTHHAALNDLAVGCLLLSPESCPLPDLRDALRGISCLFPPLCFLKSALSPF